MSDGNTMLMVMGTRAQVAAAGVAQPRLTRGPRARWARAAAPTPAVARPGAPLGLAAAGQTQPGQCAKGYEQWCQDCEDLGGTVSVFGELCIFADGQIVAKPSKPPQPNPLTHPVAPPMQLGRNPARGYATVDPTFAMQRGRVSNPLVCDPGDSSQCTKTNGSFKCICLKCGNVGSGANKVWTCISYPPKPAEQPKGPSITAPPKRGGRRRRRGRGLGRPAAPPPATEVCCFRPDPGNIAHPQVHGGGTLECPAGHPADGQRWPAEGAGAFKGCIPKGTLHPVPVPPGGGMGRATARPGIRASCKSTKAAAQHGCPHGTVFKHTSWGWCCGASRSKKKKQRGVLAALRRMF